VTESLAGKLLIATPLLDDPNFRRTVVYLCAHGPEGAFGLVVNRPVEQVAIADHLPQWLEFVSAPSVFFKGGPVEPAAAFGLARCRETAPPEGFAPLDAGVGLIDLGRAPVEYGPELRDLRLFTGYAGWGAGQLEGEIREDAWFVVEAEPADLFTAHPGGLWRAVLGRQRGELAMFEHFPDEPGLN
jgi:putative transcriptional regulator